MSKEKYIDHEGKRYFYEYRLANDGEICLATTDPDKYCNGVYAYSRKDPGDGLAFVVLRSVNINRSRGFYWCETFYQGWYPCEWKDDHWEFPGTNSTFQDDMFLQIDERPIVRAMPEKRMI